MLYALAECRIDHSYTEIIKRVYQRAKAYVRLQDDSRDFDNAGGVRQGDVIYHQSYSQPSYRQNRCLNRPTLVTWA